MVNFQDLFRSPYRCVSAPFSPLCPNNAALVRISSVLVEISSVLVRISSELVEISSELVCKIFELFLRISELLKISTFRKNRKRRTTARSFVRFPPNRPIHLFCVYCPTMTNFKTAAHASQRCFAMATFGENQGSSGENNLEWFSIGLAQIWAQHKQQRYSPAIQM